MITFEQFEFLMGRGKLLDVQKPRTEKKRLCDHAKIKELSAEYIQANPNHSMDDFVRFHHVSRKEAVVIYRAYINRREIVETGSKIVNYHKEICYKWATLEDRYRPYMDAFKKKKTITCRDVSELTGINPQQIGQILTRMRRDGLIKATGKVSLRDGDRLNYYTTYQRAK